MNRPTFISVDWDFFLYNGFHDTKSDKWMLYDWGHSESHSALLQKVLWQNRVGDMLRNGLDPLEATGFRGLEPREFVNDVVDKIEVGEIPVYYADSHSYGLLAARYAKEEAGRPVHVVSFDAHHDLGYSKKSRASMFKNDHTDCATWLDMALRHRLAASAEIVYPDWRGLSEWEGWAKQLPHIKHYAETGKVVAKTWSQWLDEQHSYGEASGIFLARSSAWTPPWWDEGFNDLIYEWGKDSECFDCTYDEAVGAHNACTPREWDMAEALRWAEDTKERIAALKQARA